MPAILEKLLAKVMHEKRDIVKLLEQDPYGALCLRSHSCTAKDIKKAYRKLALKYHPDKNKGIKTNDSFQAIQTAYETLRDPRRRRDFDNTAMARQVTEDYNSVFSGRIAKSKRGKVHVNDGTSSESEGEDTHGTASQNAQQQRQRGPSQHQQVPPIRKVSMFVLTFTATA
jgi:curved DNA-binding protein CbpA